jgi:hypothetical protein
MVTSAEGYKKTLGGLAVAIMLVAYGVQLWKTYEGKSEPHPIAWLGFGFLTGVGFLVQWQENAGAGSWVMGATAFFCLLVGGMSQYKKRWRVTDFGFWDWASLAAGVGLFALYLISRNLSWGPFVSAVLATFADLVLYIPIFTKAWLLPDKENRTSYGLNSLKFVPSLFAMDAYSVETCLYPAAMIVVNAVVVVYLFWRRQQLRII